MVSNDSLVVEFENELEHQMATGEFVFPTFPDVVFRIRSALMDQRCSADKLCKIVSSEPVLSAHVLKTANSTAFNPTGRSITELPPAVTRLGFFMVRNIAYAVGYKQLILKNLSREVLEDIRNLWQSALGVGSAAYVVGLRADTNPHEAFLAGLMHNIGECYIRYAAGQKPELYKDHAKMDRLIEKWEGPIATAILQSWGLAEETCAAIASQKLSADQLPINALAYILRASIALVADENDNEAALHLNETFVLLGIHESGAANLRHQAQVEHEAILSALG